MPDSTLEALFCGKIIPWERRNSDSVERRELESKIDREKQYFIEKLTLDDCRRFQELESLYTEAAFDEETNIFTYGFTLGALLIMEVMLKKEMIVNS